MALYTAKGAKNAKQRHIFITYSCAGEQLHIIRGCGLKNRSAETEDTTIADISVASGAGMIRTGAPSWHNKVSHIPFFHPGYAR